jgi:hypothetical protein
MKKWLLCLVTLPINLSINAQSGTDEPCNAPFLTAYTSCAAVTEFIGNNNQSPSLTNSTNLSSGVSLPTLICNGFDNASRDFWYRCVVPASGKVTIVVDYGPTNSYSQTNIWDMAVYTSSSTTCAGSIFTEVGKECTATNLPFVKLTGLTVGKTIYIRMWAALRPWESFYYSFKIWATDGTVASPVACPTLVSPTMGVSLTADPFFIWTNDPLATKQTIYFGQKSDIKQMQNFLESATRSPATTMDSSGIAHAYYSGGVNTIVESDALNFWFVHQKNCATDRNPSCTPASYIGTSVPANDECAGAINLNMTNVYKKYTSGAAFMSQLPATCSGTTSAVAADVWFKFTTNATGGTVTVKLKTAKLAMDGIVQAFSGTCSALTAIKCVDAVGVGGEELLILPNLTANTTYYVRVYALSADSQLYGEEFDIAISGNIVIPVELVDFIGKIAGNKNVLNWQTASERNAQSFIVERSADGENGFIAVGSVKAMGTTLTPQYYSFSDDNPISLSYYRLNQIDIDGKETKSKVVSVQRKERKLALEKVFPSPVTSDLTVEYIAERNGQIALNVFDIFGRLMLNQYFVATEGGNQSKISLEKLAAGTYVLKLSDTQKMVQMRIIKQ